VCGEHTNCNPLPILNFQRTKMATEKLRHFIHCLNRFRRLVFRKE